MLIRTNSTKGEGLRSRRQKKKQKKTGTLKITTKIWRLQKLQKSI